MGVKGLLIREEPERIVRYCDTEIDFPPLLPCLLTLHQPHWPPCCSFRKPTIFSWAVLLVLLPVWDLLQIPTELTPSSGPQLKCPLLRQASQSSCVRQPPCHSPSTFSLFIFSQLPGTETHVVSLFVVYILITLAAPWGPGFCLAAWPGIDQALYQYLLMNKRMDHTQQT